MTAQQRKDTWQWIAGTLVTALLAALGWGAGAYTAVNEHETLVGHPATVQRVADDHRRLERIETKIDRLICLTTPAGQLTPAGCYLVED